MATATSHRTGSADAIAALAERYDPDVVDLRRGRARVRLETGSGRAYDAVIAGRRLRLREADESAEPDAVLSADPATWAGVAADYRGGMEAFRAGRLRIRGSLHVGVGFLAATNGADEPGRLEFETLRTRDFGAISVLSAGTGPKTILCVPGLGGSDKPIGAPYDAAWFAESVFAAMDELGVENAHLAGNSMGGRVAIEAGLTDRDRIDGLALLSPALAWLR